MKAVIFDFDGTLANTLPICIEAFKRVFLKHLNIEMNETEIKRRFGPTEKGVIRDQMGDEWQACYQDYLQVYESLHDANLCLEEGLESFLSTLNEKGIRSAIVSGKGADTMAISLRHLGLEERFEKVITGSDHGADKRNHLKALLSEWHIQPEDAMYIGDTAYDMKVANELGMIAVGAAWTPGSSALELMNENPVSVFTKAWLLKDWFNDYQKQREKIRDKNKTMYFMFLIILFCVFMFMMQK